MDLARSGGRRDRSRARPASTTGASPAPGRASTTATSPPTRPRSTVLQAGRPRRAERGERPTTGAERGDHGRGRPARRLDQRGAAAALVRDQPVRGRRRRPASPRSSSTSCHGTRYEAERGGGAPPRRRADPPSSVHRLADAIVGLYGLPAAHLGWAQFRALGAAALDLCAVADGPARRLRRLHRRRPRALGLPRRPARLPRGRARSCVAADGRDLVTTDRTTRRSRRWPRPPPELAGELVAARTVHGAEPPPTVGSKAHVTSCRRHAVVVLLRVYRRLPTLGRRLGGPHDRAVVHSRRHVPSSSGPTAAGCSCATSTATTGACRAACSSGARRPSWPSPARCSRRSACASSCSASPRWWSTPSRSGSTSCSGPARSTADDVVPTSPEILEARWFRADRDARAAARDGRRARSRWPGRRGRRRHPRCRSVRRRWGPHRPSRCCSPTWSGPPCWRPRSAARRRTRSARSTSTCSAPPCAAPAGSR